MILTASFGSAIVPLPLADVRSLVSATASAGFDAAFFTRSAGTGAPMLDAVPLIAALASVPVEIGLGASVPIGYSEPFHLARAFAAIDRLTAGRSAVVVDAAADIDLAAAIGHGVTGGSARTLEFFAATTGLWDSWEDDAILVDRPGGLFTDPGKIHRLNHDGPYYTVRGPLNAPRPIQGWPVIVMPAAACHGPILKVADVVLAAGSTPEAVRDTAAGLRGPRRIRCLADLAPILGRTRDDARRRADNTEHTHGFRFVGTPEQLVALMQNWHAAGVCDGFNLLDLDRSDIDLLHGSLGRSAPPPATLRARFGLPRPVGRFAA